MEAAAQFGKELESSLVWLIILGARLYGFFTTTYVLPQSVSGRIVRSLVVIVFTLPLFVVQKSSGVLPARFEFELLAVVAVEFFKGYLLGFAVGWVFWAVEGVGNLIDNQRGAAIASAVNPLMGQEASPLAILFSQGVTAYFYAIGGMFIFLNIYYLSYAVWPAGTFMPRLDYASARAVATIFVRAFQLMFILAAPLVIVMFVAEFALAMVSRFAPQIQVFILAMPIKSALVLFLLVFFMKTALDFALLPPARFYGEADRLLRMIGAETFYQELLRGRGTRP